MIPKLIKTDADHEAALARIDRLMSAKPGTPEGDELELLVHLVETYEDRHYPVPKPSPLAAIRFRMEQQVLRPSDLVPYLGSKSRVSEVMSGKRPLSLTMIRTLHDGLGIPAEVLIEEPQRQAVAETSDVDWSDFPFAEVFKRGWFAGLASSWRELKGKADEIVGPFLRPPGMPALETMHLRRSGPTRSPKEEKALWAWEARVWHLAQSQGLPTAKPSPIDRRLIGEIARLSQLENGPVVARDVLEKSGIKLVYEPHMPGTRVDGAALRCHDGTAIVAITLRYDRLDYFWFTLCHELAHLMLHLKNDGCKVIVEDFEAEDRSRTEVEADSTAMEAMVPKRQWAAFRRRKDVTRVDVQGFAALQRLHPAIIAGRLRREMGDYTLFTDMLGHRQVRQQFS